MFDFISAEQLAAEEPVEIDWIVEQLLVHGAITNFMAKIKAGKTTFIGAMLRAMFSGCDHMGLKTHKARVLYCTEEGRITFRSFLARTGLEDTGGNLELLFLGGINRALPWPAVVETVLAHAISVQAEVVIFDTLTRWARIPAEKENDAGTAATVMEPLEIMRGANIAIMAVFHDRKSGGDVSDSARGSSAFGGAADILLGLTNPMTNGHMNRRKLSMVGRFDSADWVIDWDSDRQIYVAQSNGDAAIERTAMRSLIELHLSAAAMSGAELAAAMGTDTRDQSLRRALADLVNEGRVVRDGKGVKGSAFTYDLARF